MCLQVLSHAAGAIGSFEVCRHAGVHVADVALLPCMEIIVCHLHVVLES